MRNILLKTIFLVVSLFVFLRFSPSPVWAACNPETDSVCVRVTSITSNLLGGGSGPQSPGESVNVTVEIAWDIGIDNLIVIYAAKMIDKGGGSDNDPSSYTSPSSGGANFNTTGNHTGVRSTTFTTTIQDAGAIPLCKRIYASPYVRVLFPNGSNWGSFFGTDTSIHSSCIGATLAIFVKNASGNAIEGARVDISNGGSSNPYRLTDANGFVKVWHLDCNYSTTITISKTGYNTYSTTIPGNTSPVRNGTSGTLNVTLTIPASPSPSPSSSPSPSPSSSASPSPSPSGGLSHSCNPTTLSANWNVGAGNGCNIYIRAGSCDHRISTNCNSNWSGTQLPDNGNAACPRGLWNGWSGTLYSGNTNLGSTTISCTSSPPPGGSGCYKKECFRDYNKPSPPPNVTKCGATGWENTNSTCDADWCQSRFGQNTCPSNQFDHCDVFGPTPANCNAPPPPPPQTCAPNKVNMTITPNPADVGNSMAFRVSSTDNEGSTYIGDTWTPANGLIGLNCGCTTVNQYGNNCGIWGTRNCIAAAATSYTWTHYWSHNISGRTQPQCSKTATYTIQRPISPWIQVTGDVHSNVRIYAPGGP